MKAGSVDLAHHPDPDIIVARLGIELVLRGLQVGFRRLNRQQVPRIVVTRPFSTFQVIGCGV